MKPLTPTMVVAMKKTIEAKRIALDEQERDLQNRCPHNGGTVSHSPQHKGVTYRACILCGKLLD